MGSPLQGSDTGAKSVWYHGSSGDPHRKDTNSQSVWYDSDRVDERKHKQLEQTESEMSSYQQSCPSPLQLSEQCLTSSQLYAALSQPHAAGAQPAPSHGPATQRQEAEGSQREEEVGPDQGEGGLEGVSEDARSGEATYCIKSCQAADIEEGGEEKGAKSRKRRKKKRGRGGGTEAKLSSSSSIESQIQSETQIEQVTNLNPLSEPESEAKDKTAKDHIESPTVLEPTQTVEADKDTMLLPCQPERQNSGTHGPDSTVTTQESSYINPTDQGRMDLTEVTASQTLQAKGLSEDGDLNILVCHKSIEDFTVVSSELNDTDIRNAATVEFTILPSIGNQMLDPTEPDLKRGASPVQKTVDDLESKALSEHENLPFDGGDESSEDWAGCGKSNFQKEVPVKNPELTECTETLEADTLCVHFALSNKPVDSMERPTGFLESVPPTGAENLPCQGAADVSPLQIREGNAETTAQEYLEHCLVSEMLRDQQRKEEEGHKLWEGEEEAGKETSGDSEETDCGAVCGEINKNGLNNFECPSVDSDKEQKYKEELAVTAVAIVTVAIASAMAKIELSQLLAGYLSESQIQNADIPPEKHPSQYAYSQVESTDQATSEGHAGVKMSESVGLRSETETDILCLPAHKEEIQTETPQNKLFTRPLPKEDNQLQVYMEPLPVEVNSQGHIQTEVQLPSPVVLTGQECEHSPLGQPVCQKDRDGLLLGSQLQSKETHDTNFSLHEEFVTRQGNRGPACEQDSGENSESKTEESESHLNGFTHTSHSDHQAGEHDNDSQPVKVSHEEERYALVLSCRPILPAAPSDSAAVADPRPVKPTTPVESSELQFSSSLVDTKLVAPMSQNESNECVLDEASMDTVDGWKHRERYKQEATQDTPHTGK